MQEVVVIAVEPHVVAGHPALDFVNTLVTLQGRPKRDYLTDFEDLAAWARRAEVVQDRELEGIRAASAANRPASRRALLAARRTRASLSALFRACIEERPLCPEDLKRFNAALSRSLGRRQLMPVECGAFEWDWRGDTPALERITHRVVLAAAELLLDGHLDGRVRVCASESCDALFLDTSKNGTRRWCSMSLCGNVSKVRRFRAHKQTDSE